MTCRAACHSRGSDPAGGGHAARRLRRQARRRRCGPARRTSTSARPRCSRCSLRRPLAIVLCAIECGLGLGLIVTAGGFGGPRRPTCIRLGAGLLFLVATSALIELRTVPPGRRLRLLRRLQHGAGQRPDARQVRAPGGRRACPPSGWRRSRACRQPAGGLGLLAILCAELLLIGALSPEVGEGLIRLGYSEPCELRERAGGAHARRAAAQQAVAPVRRPDRLGRPG